MVRVARRRETSCLQKLSGVGKTVIRELSKLESWVQLPYAAYGHNEVFYKFCRRVGRKYGSAAIYKCRSDVCNILSSVNYCILSK